VASPAVREWWGCLLDAAVIAENLALVRERVGPDVQILAATKYVEAGDLPALREGRADLWLCAERALRGRGVEQVAVAGECSICTPGRYFSHRRDRGVTGRQGVVGLLA
jgi:copper oxidase (laccase) domain-containing protein